MKVLLISSDISILDSGSSGHASARDNALAIGELHVLLAASVSEDRDEGSLFIHAVKTTGFGHVSFSKKAEALITQYSIGAVWSQDAFERGMCGLRVSKKAKLPLYVNVDTDFLSPWYSMTGMFRSAQVRVPSVNRNRVKLADTVLPYAAGISVLYRQRKPSVRSR